MNDHTEISPNDLRINRDRGGIHPVGDAPASPMAQAMYTLQDEISEMGRTLDDMANLIAPIVGPDLSDSGEKAGNPMANNSELVVNIVDQASRVRNQRLQLEALMRRVEL